jgi:hypothetical protein
MVVIVRLVLRSLAGSDGAREQHPHRYVWSVIAPVWRAPVSGNGRGQFGGNFWIQEVVFRLAQKCPFATTLRRELHLSEQIASSVARPGLRNWRQTDLITLILCFIGFPPLARSENRQPMP